MLVVRRSPSDGLYREIEIQPWDAEKEQLWRNGASLTGMGLSDHEKRFIETGEAHPSIDPLSDEATEPAPKMRKKRKEQS